MPSQLPERIDPDHPIIRQEYAVYTPPINQMIETISSWVDRRVPGGYIYGASRFGKSRGVRFHVRRELELSFKSALPLVVWVRPSDMQKSERAFWHEILCASGFEFVMPDKPKGATESRYLVQQRLMTIARDARTNYVILMIDEAQDLTFHEWRWLTGLQNKLDYYGFRFSVFSIGTQQLAYEHSLLGKSGNAHVAARFMVESTRFHGLSSVRELRYVLTGYDEDSEWPIGSGRSFHQYFSPKGFDEGQRLAATAKQFWAALRELVPKSKEFPMQHIAFAVEGTLKRLAQGADWNELTSQQGWRDALTETSLHKHMAIVSTAG
jgi:hypothetical protein